MKRKLFFIYVILLISILTACSSKQKQITNNEVYNNVYNDTYYEENIEEKQMEINEGIKCPFTGQKIEKSHYLFAVMINNEPKAVPQSSLEQAEILYEALIEGGATRIMAIYHHTIPSKVGPIRSARPYFMQIAKSLNAYYVHCGGSPQAYRMLKQGYLKNIDAIYIGRNVFFRTKDRKAPHNLYSSMEQLIKYAENKKFVMNSPKNMLTFGVDELAKNESASDIYLRFSGWYYVNYKYDHNNKYYLRYEKEESHIDKETRKQLIANNIVALFAKYNTISNDDSGRQEVDFSKGKGYVFQQGKAIPINYTFNEKSSFILTTEEGKKVNFVEGNTWFEIVPQYGKINYK